MTFLKSQHLQYVLYGVSMNSREEVALARTRGQPRKGFKFIDCMLEWTELTSPLQNIIRSSVKQRLMKGFLLSNGSGSHGKGISLWEDKSGLPWQWQINEDNGSPCWRRSLLSQWICQPISTDIAVMRCQHENLNVAHFLSSLPQSFDPICCQLLGGRSCLFWVKCLVIFVSLLYLILVLLLHCRLIILLWPYLLLVVTIPVVLVMVVGS